MIFFKYKSKKMKILKIKQFKVNMLYIIIKMPAKKNTSTVKRQRKPKAPVDPPVAQVVAPEPVVHAPVVQESTPVTSDPVQESTSSGVPDWSHIESSFSDLNTRLQEFKVYYSGLVNDVRSLQKNVQRYLRDSSKRNRRRRVKDPNAPKRAPSGFAKPALISNELCSFLGKPSGTEMARTEVTKHLTLYIKQHSLQDENNRRKILPDSKLKKLLNVPDGEEVTYFNLQKYMKVHFPKTEASTSA